jgi:uncharacterized membrane protein
VRRAYIDWLRGLAVLFMIEWHSIDAWTRLDARDSWWFGWTIFFGGWAAPLFLFLAGVSVAFAGYGRMRARSLTRAEAGWALQKRGWEIFLIAHIFRIVSFLLSPGALWSSVLKPDILNILGLGLAGAAFCWTRSTTPLRRALWLLGPSAAIVLLSPGSRGWWWPTLLYPRFEAYIRPVGSQGVFPIFPAAAFVFAGAFLGDLMAVQPAGASAERRFHAQLGAGGVALWLLGWAASYLPPLSSRSQFWTTSISLIVIRIGVMTAGLALAWLWFRRPSAARWSPLVLFGRTSLFVYMVHVQLAYGIFSTPLHHALTFPEALVAYGLFTLGMLAWAWRWERRRGRPWIPAHLKNPFPALQP